MRGGLSNFIILPREHLNRAFFFGMNVLLNFCFNFLRPSLQNLSMTPFWCQFNRTDYESWKCWTKSWTKPIQLHVVRPIPLLKRYLSRLPYLDGIYHRIKDIASLTNLLISKSCLRVQATCVTRTAPFIPKSYDTASVTLLMAATSYGILLPWVSLKYIVWDKVLWPKSAYRPP